MNDQNFERLKAEIIKRISHECDVENKYINDPLYGSEYKGVYLARGAGKAYTAVLNYILELKLSEIASPGLYTKKPSSDLGGL